MSSAVRSLDEARREMVADLVRRRIIRTPAVDAAFRAVPRHDFLPSPFRIALDPLGAEFEETADPVRAYRDAMILLDPERTIHSSAPGIVAEQIERLAPAEGMRMLHVGTGTGYYTAILAQLVGERGSVVGVEYEPDLAEIAAGHLARHGYTTVTVREGDGALGVPEAAPFDRILVSAGAADIVPPWVDELDDGGRLVLPFCQLGAPGIRVSGGAVLTVIRSGDALYGHLSTVALFAPLRGAAAPTEESASRLADALVRWHALEEFLRADLPIRIVMKATAADFPDASSVPWFLETEHAVLWVQPN